MRTAEDFAAVAAFGSSPNVTVVAPEKGIKTLQQLVPAERGQKGFRFRKVPKIWKLVFWLARNDLACSR
jgi:hypothetical protein